MVLKRFDKLWSFALLFLFIVLICSIAILIGKLAGAQPAEITLYEARPSPYSGEVLIAGAVANPGFYPFKSDDTVESIIRAAGLGPKADTGKLKIYVSKSGEISSPQKINVNHAEVWLLEALPGIGQGRAQSIITYRTQNGYFKRIDDLLKVEGIGKSTFDKIKDLITVED